MCEHTMTQVYPFAPSDAFHALMAIFQRPGCPYRLTNVDYYRWTFYLCAGLSLYSWGENLVVTVYSTPEGLAQIWIRSTSKFALIDWGKNQKNVCEIFTMLGYELQNYRPLA